MKDKEENTIKIISYVSKANQTQREMINLSITKMQNIKFQFDENKNDIKFEKYDFNESPVPENIEIQNITYNSCNIKYDVKNLNFDLNKIKCIIEIRKENENYQKVYEGNKNQYLINNLTSGTNYDIRICLINYWNGQKEKALN